jgi:hypothetical protein
MFSGLVIGGPRDGEYLSSSSPSLEVVELQNLPSYGDGDIPAKLDLKTATYFFEAIKTGWNHSECQHGFWRLHGDTLNNIIQKLCTAYAHKAKAARKRKRRQRTSS